AIWRPSTGTWWLLMSSGRQVSQGWGQAGDVPVPGDYDGDGKTDFGIWRPSTGTWWVLSSTKGQLSQSLGQPGDIPVNTPVGYRRSVNGSLLKQSNFDGDWKTDVAVWGPATGTWSVMLSSSGDQVSQRWGQSGDVVVPGDYDGDGKTDYAIWRSSTG